MKFIFKILLIVSLITANQYNGRDDPCFGDHGATQGGRMNGNRVLLYFENNTQLSGGKMEVEVIYFLMFLFGQMTEQVFQCLMVLLYW